MPSSPSTSVEGSGTDSRMKFRTFSRFSGSSRKKISPKSSGAIANGSVALVPES